eukprot:COSAG01_NODE_7575_length_3142_cov_1.938547_4_plen_99_part_00
MLLLSAAAAVGRRCRRRCCCCHSGKRCATWWFEQGDPALSQSKPQATEAQLRKLLELMAEREHSGRAGRSHKRTMEWVQQKMQEACVLPSSRVPPRRI